MSGNNEYKTDYQMSKEILDAIRSGRLSNAENLIRQTLNDRAADRIDDIQAALRQSNNYIKGDFDNK